MRGQRHAPPLFTPGEDPVPIVQAVQPIGRVEVQLCSFLTTALEGVNGQQHAPAALYPRERHGTHCTGLTPHRESRVIALLFLDHGIRRGEKSVSRPGRNLPPGTTRYPLYRRLGGFEGRSGRAKNLAPTGLRSAVEVTNELTVHPACHRGVHGGNPFIPNVFCCPLETHSVYPVVTAGCITV